MNDYWNNLRPFEKRMLVAIGTLFFVVLNFFFVIPHFSDLAAMRARESEAQRKLDQFKNEIARTNAYAIGLRDMQRENPDVPPEDQSLQFANAINLQAGQSQVRFLSNGRILTLTNQFFIEKSQTISVQGKESQIVDFLYKLGAGDSQIRVRDLSLRPDGSQQELVANVKLVASYQKKGPSRAAAPAGAPARPPAPAASGPPLAASDSSGANSANPRTK